MHSKIDYSIWEGVTTKGKIERVLYNGKVIVENEMFMGIRGQGKYIARSLSSIFS